MSEPSSPDLQAPSKKGLPWRIVTALAAMFVAGAGVTYAFIRLSASAPSDDQGQEIHENTGQYSYINPLLECDLGPELLGQNTRPSRSALTSIIDDEKSKGNASFVSVYYRDLNNGPTLGINENEPFHPASLLKVGLMMYYLKQAETNPDLLSQKVEISDVTDTPDQYFKPSQQIELHTPYTIEELIKRSVVYSDNLAFYALAKVAPKGGMDTTFSTLHIEPVNGDDDYKLTIKQYAGFFRVLFNASYLSSSDSEKALALLAQSDFNKGLTAQLPASVPVAHKFGEFWTVDGTEHQLHDCGIVYVPKRPYLLCVMTRGADLDRLASVISHVSKEVYDEVSSAPATH